MWGRGGQGGFYSCSNTEIKPDSASELAELAARAKTSLRKTAEPREEPAMSTLGLSAQLPLVRAALRMRLEEAWCWRPAAGKGWACCIWKTSRFLSWQDMSAKSPCLSRQKFDFESKKGNVCKDESGLSICFFFPSFENYHEFLTIHPKERQ